MTTPYSLLFDTVLTRLDPENAHRLGFAALRAGRPVLPALRRAGGVRAGGTARGAEPVTAMGLTFPGPLGMAAGFDKNAVGIDALAGLGFSFVEVGTVTGEPQSGNPRPRLFRLPEDRAVVNRMGFNNDGAEAVARRLAARRRRPHRDVVVGVNIGKTKVVPEAEAVTDYVKSTRLLAPHADYLVVNVSSPNTPGLRDLQAVDRLGPLLDAVRRAADAATEAHLPLLVKIAPDLADDDVRGVAELVLDLGLDGVVATNTTIARGGLRSSADAVAATGAGGLSGAPLKGRATEVLALLRQRLGSGPAVVSVGGIETVEDARARLDAGATLLQAYTAFIYEGPLWPSRLQRELTRSTASCTPPAPSSAPSSPSSSPSGREEVR